jgi:hypothetical protein
VTEPLIIGDEVTVDGELTLMPVEISSFWATVIQIRGEGQYVVVNNQGLQHAVKRS